MPVPVAPPAAALGRAGWNQAASANPERVGLLPTLVARDEPRTSALAAPIKAATSHVPAPLAVDPGRRYLYLSHLPPRLSRLARSLDGLAPDRLQGTRLGQTPEWPTRSGLAPSDSAATPKPAW
jgi:hypothetical protein